jgi:shikimate dehydrogenase
VISGRTRLAAIIGDPVTHSLSPVMHNAGFAAAGVDWVYTAFEVPAGEARRALDAMRVLGIAGLSVTMPHKEAVADLVDELDPAAAALRSVNTVVPLRDGRLKGHSTDGAGFVSALSEEGVDVRGCSVCVLGAGGAARAIIDALARAGAASITVINRSAERGATAAAVGGSVARVGDLDAVATCDIVVNATSVGMGSADLPIDPTLLHASHVVVDIVYHPRRTALLAAAVERGARPVDGLGMLVHQAVLQQQLWTGVAPDAAVLRAAAERELSAAGQ